MNAELDLRRRRLAETIAWCSLQKLQNNPPESDEIKARRALGERARNHAYAAYQLEASSPFKWVTRGKVKRMREEAMQMYAEARLDKIAPLLEQLRTPAFKPTRDFTPNDSHMEQAALVETVCEVRARRLNELGACPEPEKLSLSGGKILRYCYEDNDASGAAKYDSKGFYDVEGAPPWDIWVCYHEKYVVCFVPRILCGLAQRGIEVDPVECIKWADSRFVAELFGEFSSSGERRSGQS